jgi:D-alanyl-D-alanine carboxypeptidase
MISEDYQLRVNQALQMLGIPQDYLVRSSLPFYAEARELVVAETDANGKDYLLIPAAAEAWKAMKQAALQDDIRIEIVSSFRDLERQIAIIRNKLDRGMPIAQILTLSAPPGYSEHHTGRAVDINTPGCCATEEEFEDTAAFRWLSQHAGDYGFTLSYPPNNSLGFIYEPWHWCWQCPAA